MTSTGHRTDRDHPILAALSAIDAEIDAVEHAPAWSLSDAETRQALVRATRLAARVAALELKVAAHADRNQVGDASGATSASVWWANHTRMTQREAARKIKLAKALETHLSVADALAAGDVLVDQAHVITEAVDELPDTVHSEVRTQAREHLLAAARRFDAKALRIQGRRILDVVAPEIGETEEARQLAAEEKQAEQAARLTMHDDGQGQTHGRFTLPNAEADMLRKAVQAIASPKAGGHGLSPHGMGLALGGRSEVLDVGRSRRFHTKAQRIAMAVRDRGCVAMGCERPTSACDAHHLIPWSKGGETSVEKGILLCRRHHTLAHHRDYDLTHHPAGKISFTKRE